MTETSITSTRGLPLPNLAAMHLEREMKAAHTLIAEQDRLRRRADELGYEQQRLQEEIRQREHERTAEWGRAIRAGEEAPGGEAIEAAKRQLEEVRREADAVRHAGDLGDGELKQVVAEHALEWDHEVQARAEKLLAEAQEIADALSAKLAEIDPLIGVHTWLRSGGQRYAPPVPATISIEHLLAEKRLEVLG
jgi:hypothetical protein